MQYWRIHLILAFIFLFAAVIIGRLVFLQILRHDFYSALSKGQQIFSVSEAERMEVFLKDNEGSLYPLAINKNKALVYASPKEIENDEETVEVLSQILKIDKDLILERLGQKESLYQPIKTGLTKEEIALLKKEKLPGIYRRDEVARFYPQERYASQVIGFLGGEGEGQYGIEGYYQDVLGGLEARRDSDSPWITAAYRAVETIKSPDALVLTLDYNIQSMAEKLLEDAQEQLGFEEGQIIVIRPKSGQILALANTPTFNPNNYQEETDLEIFQNGAIQKIFEPGSVFKPITMAAALEEGRVTPETTYYDTGEHKIGGSTIYNYDKRVWGEQTMTEVLEKSINTGAVFVEQKLGHESFIDFIERFGFFKPTVVDLQGEVFSKNLEFKKGYEINFATASFGQGIEVTAIQLVRAFCAIANGGVSIRPYLLKEVGGGSSEAAEVADAQRPTRIISSKTASQLTAMLVSVVENGFAKAAGIPGYYIAGKTGTAQISWSALGEKRRGYSDETIQTFVGFAPAFNPQFLALVKLDNPGTKTAEYSAVPIFRDLAKYIIDYLEIPPDHE